MTTAEVLNLRLLDESHPSLCIPRVFNNITDLRIHKIINEFGLGKINRIDIKEYKNEKDETFKRVYIHFEKWFWNEYAQVVRKKVILGNEIKMIYDNPWFWKVSASKLLTPPVPPPFENSKYLQDKTKYNTNVIIGRELPLTKANNSDAFGRDLSLKRDYDTRQKQKLERYNKRLDTPAIIKTAQVIEEPIQERKMVKFVSITEDPDDLNIKRFEIDYGVPLPPPKIKRIIIKKVQHQTKDILSPKPRINWYDTNTDTDTETDEEEELDIYADL